MHERFYLRNIEFNPCTLAVVQVPSLRSHFPAFPLEYLPEDESYCFRSIFLLPGDCHGNHSCLVGLFFSFVLKMFFFVIQVEVVDEYFDPRDSKSYKEPVGGAEKLYTAGKAWNRHSNPIGKWKIVFN